MPDWTSTGIGFGLGALGSLFGASSASKRKHSLSKLADVAAQGVDYDQITGEALAGMETAFPSATTLGSKLNAYYSDELQKALEAAYPGRAGQMAQYSGLVGDLMSGGGGVLDTARESLRRAAVAGVGGGTMGSQFAGANALRLNYNQTLQNMLAGMGMFQQSASAFPYASPTDVSGLMGLTPAQRIGYEQQNLQNFLNLKGQSYGAQTGGEVWGDTLSGLGGLLAGYGVGAYNRGGTGWPTGLMSGDVTGFRAGVGIGNPYGDVMRGLYE